MKFKIFANKDARIELGMFIVQLFVAGTAGISVFLSDYQPFAPAVFFVVFLLQRINDTLLLQDAKQE